MLARWMSMRKVSVAAVGVVMALAVLPAALSGSGQPAAATRITGATPGAAAPASGEQFAIQVLDSAPLPPGAQPWTAAAPAVLDGPMLSVVGSALTDLDALYLVDEPAGPALTQYVLAHLPAGATVQTSGSSTGPSGDATGFVVSLPTSGANESMAQLLYATTETSEGYVLRVDAQVVWVPDRSPADAIRAPAGALLTGYTTISDMNSSSGPVTVPLGDADSVELADAINALPLATPGTCMENSLLYTITFYPTSGSGHSEVQGWLCPKVVDVSSSGAQVTSLNDSGCSVIRLVVSLVPEQAAGTRSAVQYC